MGVPVAELIRWGDQRADVLPTENRRQFPNLDPQAATCQLVARNIHLEQPETEH